MDQADQNLLSEPVLTSHSFPARYKELNNYPQAASSTGSNVSNESDLIDDYDEPDWEDWQRHGTGSAANKEENEWLLNNMHDHHYGSSVPVRGSVNSRRVRVRKRAARDHVGTSITTLAHRFFGSNDRDNDGSDDDSQDSEAPPKIEMKYRRSKLDWIKLVFLPIIYILLMGVAIVFAFYTIEGLLESYSNKVRSVQQISVGGRYPPIGIAIFPKFTDYKSCEYRYYDNLSPISDQDPRLDPIGNCGDFQIPFTCDLKNVSFNSSIVRNLTRNVMVFEGPTLVKCKQSLKLSFGIDTTMREYSAVEYILFNDWDTFKDMNIHEQREYLAFIEQNRTVYTFPAGFRTWVKMSYSIYKNFGDEQNYTEFDIIDSYGSYNDYNNSYMPMEILFEWKTNHYDYVQEIISTTVWSAFGSFCGLLLTIVKVGEFCKAWIRRLRRDKQKKKLHLQKLEEEQRKLLESYHKNRMKRRTEKAKLEATISAPIAVQTS